MNIEVFKLDEYFDETQKYYYFFDGMFNYKNEMKKTVFQKTLNARIVVTSAYDIKADSNNTNPGDPTNPSTPEDDEKPEGNTDNTNKPSVDDSSDNQEQESNTPKEVDIFLWCVGGILGILILFLLISTIRMVVRWLKE